MKSVYIYTRYGGLKLSEIALKIQQVESWNRSQKTWMVSSKYWSVKAHNQVKGTKNNT